MHWEVGYCAMVAALYSDALVTKYTPANTARQHIFCFSIKHSQAEDLHKFQSVHVVKNQFAAQSTPEHC